MLKSTLLWPLSHVPSTASIPIATSCIRCSSTCPYVLLVSTIELWPRRFLMPSSVKPCPTRILQAGAYHRIERPAMQRVGWIITLGTEETE